MKKLVSLFLAVLLLLSLASCGEEEKSELKLPQDVIAEETDDQMPVVQTPAKPKKATIPETVLYDAKDLKITAKSLSNEGIMGPELRLSIENNTDKDLTIQTRSVAINGFMVDTIMSTDVASGQRNNDTVIFVDTDLERSGITTIGTIEIAFHIFETATWDTYVNTDVITLRTDRAGSVGEPSAHEGQTVHDANNVKIVVKGLDEEDSVLGPGVVLYIENNRKQDITIQVRDAAVGENEVYPIFSCNVTAGNRAVDSITFLSSELEEYGITSIEEVEFSFSIFDMDTYDDIATSDMVTIHF